MVADVLAVAVFNADFFDDIFGGLVPDNAEGRIVNENGTAGFGFTDASVSKFASDEEPAQAAASAVLELAWKHRLSPALSG